MNTMQKQGSIASHQKRDGFILHCKGVEKACFGHLKGYLILSGDSWRRHNHITEPLTRSRPLPHFRTMAMTKEWSRERQRVI